ncbi:NTP transferase domain-containing protein [Parahaliea mediterranea]|uniref:NTP transferase domain-containing protein n=1 Tax=Parahaliea mediterranea TaxID=651086 RepID=A0A939DHD6_9GAMM|nr:NTP transferase domain-containing protein [Parahaliea mediterranea]
MKGSLDAIVLAGEGGAARPIGEGPKALLPLGGKPLLQHVLEALDAVPRVRRIVVVGARAELETCLAPLTLAHPVDILEQGATAYRNFWSAFCHLQRNQAEDPDRPVLVLAADTPLITSGELEEFLDRCDLERLDYCIGMTEERYLTRYYPSDTAPGIHMRYLHLADGSLRLNNLHLVKPLRVDNRGYIQDIYEFRYQRDLVNILRAARDLLRQPGIGWRALYLYLLLQLAEAGHALGWRGAWNFFRRRVSRAEVSAIASSVLKTRAGIVETTIGGTAIDVDNARDYATLQQRWEEFHRALPCRE